MRYTRYSSRRRISRGLLFSLWENLLIIAYTCDISTYLDLTPTSRLIIGVRYGQDSSRGILAPLISRGQVSMSRYITSICECEESCPLLILFFKLFSVYPSARKDYSKYIPCQVQGHTMFTRIQVHSFQGYLPVWYKSICLSSRYGISMVYLWGRLWHCWYIQCSYLEYPWLIQGYPYS